MTCYIYLMEHHPIISKGLVLDCFDFAYYWAYDTSILLPWTFSGRKAGEKKEIIMVQIMNLQIQTEQEEMNLCHDKILNMERLTN